MVDRNAREGEVKVILRLDDPRAAALLAERLPELVKGLERRGLKMDSVQLQNPDGTPFTESREATDRVAANQRRQHGGGDSPGDGRSRNAYVEEEGAQEAD